MEDTIQLALFDDDGLPLTKLAELILSEAVKQRASGLHLTPHPKERSSLEYIIENAPYEADSSPLRIHEPLLLVLAAMGGISPKTLPPARGNREVDFPEITVRLQAETRMSDWGEVLELSWEAKAR